MRKPMRFLAGGAAMAVAAAAAASPLFDETTVLEVRLRGPLEAVIASRTREEFPFELEIEGRRLPVEVRKRGKSRLRVCEFPPLRLDFRPDDTAGTVFAGQNRLKLVTHCTTRKRDAGNVLDEYLAYRIYGGLADTGYRVRLLRVTYEDGAAPPHGASPAHDAFLVESAGELAERTGLAEARLEGIPYARVDHGRAALLYVFQYLIGNTDWSLVTATDERFCCHNVDVFESEGRYVPVPYDFDLSGLVDASYAAPDASLPIRSVTSRYYRGYCTSRAALAEALQRVAAAEADLRRLVDRTPAGSEREMERRRAFVDRYFRETGDRDRLLRSFERRCL